MNKEFKFWCKGTSENLNFNKKGWWTFPDYLLSKYYDGLSIFESEDFVACQWTGLTDCNGQKIYEGDILFFIPFFRGKEDCASRIGLVEWSNYDASFRVNEVHKGQLNWDFHTFCELKEVNRFYVKGNIFEHPELLK